MDMRGLANFIHDIRKATSNREEEQRRIEVELAKIRSKFKETASMSTYDRKKYVVKLMFIAMLGYPVDFGHMEGVQLLANHGAPEKLIGYLSLTVFLNENHELLTLTTHMVHLDLVSSKEFNQCLALTAVANIGGKDFAESMHQGVKKLLVTPSTSIQIRKKAFLTYLRLYRKYREVADVDEIVPIAVECITHPNFGLSNCAITFLLGVAHQEDARLFTNVVPQCIALMSSIIVEKRTEVEYIYYGVPAPWLQAKALRLLQQFPAPASDSPLKAKMTNVLSKLVKATEKVLRDAQTQQKQRGTANRCNAMNAALVEAVSLIIQWDADAGLLKDCSELLSTFINDKKDANFRYLGLLLLSRLSFTTNTTFSFADSCRPFQQQIIVALHDVDISIRKQALSVTYNMCGPHNADEIIGELLAYLPTAEASFKEDLVLIIAILAEKFCTDYAWYVEIVLNVISHAGDHVPDDIWQRVIHVVVNNPAVQKRAAEIAFLALKATTHCHETTVKVSAFLLGEFGYQIALSPESTPLIQFTVLHSKFNLVSSETRCMLLSTFVKFFNLYDNPAVRERIQKTFASCKSSFDAELQQRATEYSLLLSTVRDETLMAVLEPMLPFELDGNRVLDLLLEKQKSTDRNLWADKAQARDQEQTKQSSAARGSSKPSSASQPPSSSADVPPAASEKDLPPSPPPPAVVHADPSAAVLSSASLLPTVARSGASAAQSTLDDLFGITAPPPQQSVNEQRLRELVDSLRIAPSGLLYSDAVVDVVCSHEYRAADARLAIRVKNKSAESALSLISAKIVLNPSGLLIQTRECATTVPAAAAVSGDGGVLVAEFAARSLSPYDELPSIRLSYSAAAVNTAVSVILSLPIATTRFVDPYPLDDMSKFSALWVNTPCGDMSFVNNDGRAVRFPRGRKEVTEVEQFMFQKMRLSTLRPTANLVLGAGAHAVYPKLSPEYTPVLVKVELAEDGCSARIAVRSPHPAVQAEMQMLFVKLFL
jgi:AP-2 complex subunit alpha